MDFTLTDEQRMIADSAREVLDDLAGGKGVERAIVAEQGYESKFWDALRSELGWTALSVPEPLGGMGLGAVEVVLVLEQTGRTSSVSPFLSTVMAIEILKALPASAQCDEALKEIASGERWFGVALSAAPSAWSSTAPSHTLRALDADAPGGLLLARPTEAGLQWRLLDPEDAAGHFRRIDSIDPTHRLFDAEPSAAIEASTKIGVMEPSASIRVTSLARLYLAAERLGDAQACLDLTGAHVAERVQFGRPLAGFQAIKHRCAEMMVRIETLRSQVYGAAASADSASETDFALECMAARALSIDTAFWCAQEAIQLHGGVGFTWEYQPHWHFKRAQATRDWLGSADALREQIAEQLLVQA